MKPIEIKLEQTDEMKEIDRKQREAFATVSQKLQECAKLMSDIGFEGTAHWFLAHAAEVAKPLKNVGLERLTKI